MTHWPLWTLYLMAFGAIALSGSLFALMLYLTWGPTKAAAGHLVGWFRSVPARIREMNDPVLRRRRKLTDEYQAIVVALLIMRQAVREDADPAALRAFEAAKLALTSFFEGLSEADLETLSAFVAEGPLQGKVAIQEVRDFMREEQSVVAATPYLAPKHLDRMVMRFHRRIDHGEEG